MTAAKHVLSAGFYCTECRFYEDGPFEPLNLGGGPCVQCGHEADHHVEAEVIRHAKEKRS